jgi:solute carrier family 10 (sodium/bile acid cotransporter), member 7
MPLLSTGRLRSFLPDTFVVGLLAMVLLASLLPARGDAASALGLVVSAAVVLLFFMHGLRLSRDAVVAGFGNWRLHGAILGITFGAYPLLVLGFSLLFPALLPRELWLGMMFLACVPSTVQSSIALVSIARGNVGGAVAQAAASNVIGTLATPLLVGAMITLHYGAADISGVRKVVAQLLVPFVVGHLLRPLLLARVERYFPQMGKIDKATILLVVYSAFSVAVGEGIWSRIGLDVLAALTLACLVVLGAGLLISGLVGRAGGFSSADRITIRYAGTLKSLATGVPMAQLLLPASQIGMILIPLMLFHQLQLIVCSWLAGREAARPQDFRKGKADVPAR